MFHFRTIFWFWTNADCGHRNCTHHVHQLARCLWKSFIWNHLYYISPSQHIITKSIVSWIIPKYLYGLDDDYERGWLALLPTRDQHCPQPLIDLITALSRRIFPIQSII